MRTPFATCLRAAMLCLLASSCQQPATALQVAQDVTPMKADGGALPNEVFEVISIHRSRPDQSGFSVRPNENNFLVTGSSLEYLIQLAYGVFPSQIQGIPFELKEQRFDVRAKAETSDCVGQAEKLSRERRQHLLRLRLQAMLKDRFKLNVEPASKRMSSYAMTLSSGGSKLLPATDPKGYTTTWGHLSCSSTTMDQLADILSTQLQSFVDNSTHLTGAFAFELKWDTHDSTEADDSFPSLRNAMRDQLGLKLTPVIGVVPVLLVKHVEEPSIN